MSDITVKDIKKAMKTLEKNKVVPARITMNPVMKDKVIKMLNDQGIETKGADGNDYVFGMKVITEDMCVEDVAYINQVKGNMTLKARKGKTMDDYVVLTPDEAESIIAFIKSHEREDIPESVWDICMDLYKQLGFDD